MFCFVFLVPLSTVYLLLIQLPWGYVCEISFNNIYQSREVIEKEIVSYQIIRTLLNKFIIAFNNKYNGNLSNYDSLILKILLEKCRLEKENLLVRSLHICHFISILTKGSDLFIYKAITFMKN